MNNVINSSMRNKEKTISTDEFTQGRYSVVFPPDIDKEEIEFIRTKLFKFLERHSCIIKRIDDE